jgi:hypothetical protein
VTFTELKAELAARGFARLTDAQLGSYITRAITEIHDIARWPFLEASVTGTAPLAITDLGTVDVVFDTTSTDRRIPGLSYQTLVGTYGDLSSNGAAPSFWYLAYPAGVPTVATYPVSTVTIGVQYYRVPSDLSAGADEPVVPERYHGLIVDIAARKALRGKSDNDGANALQVEIDRELAGMREGLLYQPQAGPTVLPMGGEDY